MLPVIDMEQPLRAWREAGRGRQAQEVIFDCAQIVSPRLVALPQREFPANGSKPFFLLEMQAGSAGSFDLYRYPTGAG